MRTSSPSADGKVRLTLGGFSPAWEAIRIGLGALYLLGALAHIAIGLLAPEVYHQFANQALVGQYADLWISLIAPNIAILLPLIIIFEISVMAFLFWRGTAVLIGHAAGAGFQVALVLSGPWGPINAGLSFIHLFALRQTYCRTVIDIGKQWVSRGVA